MPLLHLRITNELAERLDERRKNADLNVSSFVRRAIETELDRPTSEPAPTRHAPVLFTPKMETR
jgi:hypothetical protein